MSPFDDGSRVVPDGLGIRRRRRRRGWSPRALVRAIAEASVRESGLPDTVSLSLLAGMEEANEAVSYATVCRVAAGLDCNPMELVLETG
jgi:hypothetical protein